jgi:multimeric flavodoxin WrbA
MRVLKGQAPGRLDRDEFGRRFRLQFSSARFDREREAIGRIEERAWEAYQAGEKSPRTRAAGPGFADPSFELSVDWLEARQRILAAAAVQRDSSLATRVLVVAGASRNDGTCPSEISKTFRLATLALDAVLAEGQCEVDLLDLSLLVSEYGRRIHPCKACVSTAMPLCHFPCSCYPNYSLGQSGDWMNEIYERWMRAHGVIVLTPVYWYQLPSPLKLMMDRLVCADGGNPDPTTTRGKDAAKAKELELAGWSYPKHLAGRSYGVVAHGDAEGVDGSRQALCDWLDWMGLVDAGPSARLGRSIGYYEPYATSHDALDRDQAVQEEVRNVARAVVRAARLLRRGVSLKPDAELKDPRPK